MANWNSVQTSRPLLILTLCAFLVSCTTTEWTTMYTKKSVPESTATTIRPILVIDDPAEDSPKIYIHAKRRIEGPAQIEEKKEGTSHTVWKPSFWMLLGPCFLVLSPFLIFDEKTRNVLVAAPLMTLGFNVEGDGQYLFPDKDAGTKVETASSNELAVDEGVWPSAELEIKVGNQPTRRVVTDHSGNLTINLDSQDIATVGLGQDFLVSVSASGRGFTEQKTMKVPPAIFAKWASKAGEYAGTQQEVQTKSRPSAHQSASVTSFAGLMGFEFSKLDGDRRDAFIEAAPLCAAGNAEACKEIGHTFKRSADEAQALNAYKRACSLWTDEDANSANVLHAEIACLEIGQIYQNKNDDKTAYAYASFGCKNFNHARDRACGDQQYLREQFEQEAEIARMEAEAKREEAESDRQMMGMIFKGLFDIAGTAARGQQQLEAAKRGIVLPPASSFTPPSTFIMPGGALNRPNISEPPALPAPKGGGQCSVQCAAMTKMCEKSGGQTACHRAASCLCRCEANTNPRLASDVQAALRQCIAYENESVQQLKSNAPEIVPSAGSSVPVNPRPPQQRPSRKPNCPPGMEVCASSAE